MKELITTSAPGNVFFMGEHAVVYGRRALVTSVNLRTKVTAEKLPQNQVVVSSAGYGKILAELEGSCFTVKRCDDVMKPAAELLEFSHQTYGMEYGANITVSSEIPPESGGLSSSTAFLSAFFHAINTLYDWHIHTSQYPELLLPFQERIHGGAASGAEFASSVFGGVHIVRRKEKRGVGELPIETERVKVRESERPIIIIADTGVKALTAVTVGEIKKLREIESDAYEEIFDEIDEVVMGGISALKQSDWITLGELMNRNAELLEKIDEVSMEINKRCGIFENFVPIVTTELKRIMDVARQAGALGVKPSGGGGGGIAIALVEERSVEKVESALRRVAARVMIAEMGVEGVKVEEEE